MLQPDRIIRAAQDTRDRATTQTMPCFALPIFLLIMSLVAGANTAGDVIA